MKIEDDYIDRVLNQLPRATPMRAQIAMELRGHIAERVAHGSPVEEVLRQLGDPTALAESYLAAVPLIAAPFLSRVGAKLIDFGTTVGKRIAGLRVVRESGAPVGLGRAIVRQMPMFLQFYTVDVLFALFTDKRQRAFEMLSKTRVVKAAPAA